MIICHSLISQKRKKEGKRMALCPDKKPGTGGGFCPGGEGKKDSD
jgi:hypothetical protein